MINYYFNPLGQRKLLNDTHLSLLAKSRRENDFKLIWVGHIGLLVEGRLWAAVVPPIVVDQL